MSIGEHLDKKWRKLFHYRDTDNDGIVTEQDYIGYAEHFVKIYGERANPTREIPKLIWDTFHPKGYKPQITEQELVDNYTYLYHHDMPGFRAKLEKYCNLSFDAIDTDGNGEISLAEYTVYQNSFNVYNQDYIKHVFNKMDLDGSGLISRPEFVDEILDYVLDDKPEKIPELYDDEQVKNFKKMSIGKHLDKKWRKLFHYRDTDNDGIVTEQDYIGYAEHFVKVYGERANPCRQIPKLIWDTFHPRGYKPQITEQELVDNYTYLYHHDMPGFRAKLEKYCNLSFDAIDTDGNGEISLAEYTVYQNSFKVYNQDYIKYVFNQMDTDRSGAISRKEFVDEILNYVLDNKPEKIPELYNDEQVKNFKNGGSS